jgi:phenylacetate-coenzyme A ligase PaaK-like adenylate-forming protein
LSIAGIVVESQRKWRQNPVKFQEKSLQYLITKARDTEFGKAHHFHKIKNYSDFKREVPLRDYEALRPYFDRLKQGKKNVLWPGRPIYFCKTSGTTSGTKYIPVSSESMPNFIRSTRNAILQYMFETGNTAVFDGKFIFIQGSPVLENISGIKTGRLSGIVAHHVPFYLQRNRKPGFATNSIENWEQKIEAIVDETIHSNMTAIGGIPPWVQMYFERLMARTGGKTVSEIFPNLTLLVAGGVNFEPYRNTFNKMIGKEIDVLDLYPASEGFFAYQDRIEYDDLLLLTNEHIFYEFIRADKVFDKDPERLSVAEVSTGVNYAIAISTSAGLWGYLIGDTVMFTSTSPHRIKVTGRIGHFTSAFGEHVIAQEVEQAISEVIKKMHCQINEFTVAPMVNPDNVGLPHHEWFIEFNSAPPDMESFSASLDQQLQNKNIYYRDLIKGKILQPLKVTLVEKNGFKAYMASRGKLGGQNKVPRLSNDRKIAEALKPYILK